MCALELLSSAKRRFVVWWMEDQLFGDSEN
jgi:hypothetical protein